MTSADVADVLNLRAFRWSIGKIARVLGLRRDEVVACLAADDAARVDNIVETATIARGVRAGVTAPSRGG